MTNSVTVTSARQVESEVRKPPFPNMVWIPGGTFLMGSDKHYQEQAPANEVSVDGFWMDRHTVTNEEFRKFVDATKHVTSAERAPKAEDYPGAKPELLVPASGEGEAFKDPMTISTLDEAEREHILRALEATGWRIEGPIGAAAMLKLHPSTLRFRMKKLGLTKVLSYTSQTEKSKLH